VDKANYARSAGVLRIYEKRMLSSAAIERASDAPSLVDTLRLLSQDTEYEFTKLKDPNGYETVMRDGLRALYKLGYVLVEEPEKEPSRDFVNILFCKYDFHNLKVAFKAAHYPQRTASPYSYVTDVKPETLEGLTDQPSEELKEMLPAYLVDAAAELRVELETGITPQKIDVVLDKAMLAYMLRIAKKVKVPMLSEYVAMAIDNYNLKLFLRGKDMGKTKEFMGEALAPGGNIEPERFVQVYENPLGAIAAAFSATPLGAVVKQGLDDFERVGNFSKLELLLDNRLIACVKQVKYMALGPELVFAYLVNKENEIRQMRIILACKQNGIAPDALKERLRDNYA
jgi:Archaeal/vacuolar-type H+-ATPase subunit C